MNNCHSERYTIHRWKNSVNDEDNDENNDNDNGHNDDDNDDDSEYDDNDVDSYVNENDARRIGFKAQRGRVAYNA